MLGAGRRHRCRSGTGMGAALRDPKWPIGRRAGSGTPAVQTWAQARTDWVDGHRSSEETCHALGTSNGRERRFIVDCLRGELWRLTELRRATGHTHTRDHRREDWLLGMRFARWRPARAGRRSEP